MTLREFAALVVVEVVLGIITAFVLYAVLHDIFKVPPNNAAFIGGVIAAIVVIPVATYLWYRRRPRSSRSR